MDGRRRPPMLNGNRAAHSARADGMHKAVVSLNAGLQDRGDVQLPAQHCHDERGSTDGTQRQTRR